MQEPENSAPPIVERRVHPDRRRHNAFTALFSRRHRRKSPGRRKEDKVGYVDFYGPRVRIFVCAVLVLSVLDALLTQKEIATGMVREANPLMNAVMAWGGMFAFYSLKLAMTALPLAVLVLHKNWPIAKFTAKVCLCCYVLVLLYHFGLLILFAS